MDKTGSERRLFLAAAETSGWTGRTGRPRVVRLTGRTAATTGVAAATGVTATAATGVASAAAVAASATAAALGLVDLCCGIPQGWTELIDLELHDGALLAFLRVPR